MFYKNTGFFEYPRCIQMASAASRGGAIMDYVDRLDMMDDDCDIQGYPLNDDRCAGCPLDGHCEFVKCKEKEI